MCGVWVWLMGLSFGCVQLRRVLSSTSLLQGLDTYAPPHLARLEKQARSDSDVGFDACCVSVRFFSFELLVIVK